MGVTSLVSDGRHLASASDDATIAMWKLPDLSVEWRSRAHGQLVNQLYLEPTSASLWSSSSDGVVKRWSWPDLAEAETVDVRELVSGPLALHAVWAAPGGNTLLAGTWRRRLLVLTRDGAGHGAYTARSIPFAAVAGYRLVGLPAVDAVALLGVYHPYEMAAFDLTRGELERLPNLGQPVRAALAFDDGRRLLGFATGVVLDYRFKRGANGRLELTVAARQQSALGIVSAAAALGPSAVAVANHRGEVMRLELAALDL